MPLSDSNILNRHLHPALKKLGWSDPKTGDGTAGNHAFRRFRNTHLRKNRVPDDLIRWWLGHAGKSMTDEYSQVRDDLKYRKLVAEQVGIGFELPVKTAPAVLNVPKREFPVATAVAVNCSEVSQITLCARSSVG
jgi:hypothetical protein